MTGFGRAEETIGNKKFTVEFRSVNSKQLDLNVKMASVYREKEIELRNALASKLQRGKVELGIFFESNGEEKTMKIDHELAQLYFNDLQSLSKSIGKENEEILPILMRMPDVMKAERAELDESEWVSIKKLIESAFTKYDGFRLDEGKNLEVDLTQRVTTIASLLKDVEPLEQERINTIKERITKNLNEAIAKENIDTNRFEQELIYYLEKFDITEEKVRLKTHCDYFIETMSGSPGQGKKLGFITQEIGREINTLGSKANHSEMQRIVVQMKDELEKIKEQNLNVL